MCSSETCNTFSVAYLWRAGALHCNWRKMGSSTSWASRAARWRRATTTFRRRPGAEHAAGRPAARGGSRRSSRPRLLSVHHGAVDAHHGAVFRQVGAARPRPSASASREPARRRHGRARAPRARRSALRCGVRGRASPSPRRTGSGLEACAASDKDASRSVFRRLRREPARRPTRTRREASSAFGPPLLLLTPRATLAHATRSRSPLNLLRPLCSLIPARPRPTLCPVLECCVRVIEVGAYPACLWRGLLTYSLTESSFKISSIEVFNADLLRLLYRRKRALRIFGVDA